MLLQDLLSCPFAVIVNTVVVVVVNSVALHQRLVFSLIIIRNKVTNIINPLKNVVVKDI